MKSNNKSQLCKHVVKYFLQTWQANQVEKMQNIWGQGSQVVEVLPEWQQYQLQDCDQ